MTISDYWSECIKKTLTVQADILVCQKQGIHRQDFMKRKMDYVCQGFYNDVLAKQKQEALLVPIKNVSDCDQFSLSATTSTLLNNVDIWKKCILKTFVSAPDLAECYRQAKLRIQLDPQKSVIMQGVCSTREKELPANY